MDEKQLSSDIQGLKDQMEQKRNELLNLRGFFRTALPQTSSEGVTLWNQLTPEQKEKYNQAAKGTGMPGSGLFFLGYREKTG